MSKTKFTPGPWLIGVEGTSTGRGPEVYVAGEYYDDGSEFVVAECGVTEARLSGKGRWKRKEDADTRDANAHLIAAAPDLYASLSEMVAIWGYPNTEKWHRAKAALAKAEGHPLPEPHQESAHV